MSRFGVFWFILVILSGATNFLVKQRVQSLDDELNHARRQTVEEQKKIHDLTAEWTFLNQPELLADLNNRYLHLVPVSPKQVQTSIDSLPMRPAAPPPQATSPQVTPPLATPQVAAASETAPAADPAGVPLDPPSAPANPVASPVANPVAAPVRAPIVTVSAPSPAPSPTMTAATAPPARSPSPPPARLATLDALFAQVAGNR